MRYPVNNNFPSPYCYLTILATSYNWNHTVFVLLWLADFIYKVLNIFPYCSIFYQNSLPFKNWAISFHYIFLAQFAHLFTYWWMIRYYHIISTMKKAIMNIGVQEFLWNPAFHDLGCIPRSTTAGSYDNSMSIFFYF
jgi:hypothetical protein